MKTTLLLTVFLLTVMMSDTVSAQRCPASKRTVRVYVQNEDKAIDLRYQLIPLKGKVSNEDLFNEQFLFNTFGVRAPVCDIPILQADRSIAVNNSYLKKFERDLEPEKEHEDFRGNKLSGKITNGELVFNASDSNTEFYILKVTSSNYQPEYLLGRFLGGCDDIDTVILRWPIEVLTTK